MFGWSTRKKVWHALILSFMALIAVLLAFFLFVYRSPNCKDGLKNQDEVGVDCGGRCQILCEIQVEEPVIYWQRAFLIRPGFYHLAAYVENKNLAAGSHKAPYYFKVYDANNLLISERYGETFLEANKPSVIFESNVSTGGRVPVRVVFGFEDDLVWTSTSSLPPVISASSVFVDTSGDFPVLSATLNNSSDRDFKDFETVVVIYDESGNAQTVSKTKVDSLSARSTTRVSFTWPSRFNFVAGRTEIIPRVYPGINY